jgi:hypothetical protein
VRVGEAEEIAEVELPGAAHAVAVADSDPDLDRLKCVDVGLEEGVALLRGERVVIFAGEVDEARVLHVDSDIAGAGGETAEAGGL